MKKITQRWGASVSALAALAGAAVLFAAAAMFFLAVPFFRILLFLLYQVAAVGLPGIVILKLFRLKLRPLENLAASYCAGILCNILIYFLLSPFGLGRVIPFAVWGVAAVSAAALCFIRRPMNALCDKGELKTGLGFAFFAATVTFLLLSAASLTPDIAGARSYYHDLTNGVALITSAYNGFPMEFLQMAGTEHFYHPFFYAYCAVMKHCLGFGSFEIATQFSLISISPLFSASFVALARHIFYKNRNIAVAAAALFLFSYGMVYYLNIDLLGFALGLTCSILALLFFIKGQEEPGKFFNRNHVLSLAFMLGATGGKGPIGVITVFGICFALLLHFLRNRNLLRTAATGFLYASSFFAAYFLLYQQGPESLRLRSEIGQWGGGRADIFAALGETLPDWFRSLLTDVLFTVVTQRIMVIAFIFMLLYLTVMRKKPKPFVDYSFGGLLAGFILFNMFIQTGSSEVYFVLAVYPAAFLAGMYAMIQLWLALKKRQRPLFGVAAAALLCPVLALSAMDVFTQAGTHLKTAISYSRFNGGVRTEEQLAALGESERAYTLTPEEYEGLIWMRDHIPEDAVLTDPRHMLNNKYFYGTAFGERRFYLEGWGYVTMEDSNGNAAEKNRREGYMILFYKNEDESFVPLLRKEGIDYVVVYDFFNPGWRFTNEYGSVTAFENEDIAIYDIRDRK